MIVHLRVVPGLCIAVEESRRPELRARPVIMGGLPHERGTVREVGFLAQERGVRPGMALSQAYQQCPEGIFLTPDPERYEEIWKRILFVLGSFTPLVEPIEAGQAVCDLSGCERRWPDSRTTGREIGLRIWGEVGIAPWLGIASNRLVAGLASTEVENDGIGLVESGEERAFVADLPLTLLPDVDERLALTFQVLGLKTAGQLAALPVSAVKQRFGVAGERLHNYARGADRRPVIPPPERPSVSARYECEEGSIEEAQAAIERLAADCSQDLRRCSLAGRMIELTLLWQGDPSLTPNPYPSRERGETPPLPSPGEGSPLPRERGGSGDLGAIPISYRIHSMLPQPGAWSDVAADRSRLSAPSRRELLERPETLSAVNRAYAIRPYERRGSHTPPSSGHQPRIIASAVVRTPIAEAAPLAERAHHLLRRHWPLTAERRSLQAIELRVSEFERPSQLGFPELNRVSEAGALAGMSHERLRTLTQYEEALAARYGDTSFRHLGRIDPDNLLADRRFHWASGLPWNVTSSNVALGSVRARPRARKHP